MKTILFAGAMTLSVVSMQAQSRNHKNTDGTVAFGIKGGVNVSTIHVENGVTAGDVDGKVGFHAGGLAHIHVNKYFALQPEILYSNQGYKYTLANQSSRINLHYINLPVLGQFMVGDGFRLETGPQLGILAAASQKAGKTSTDIKDNMKPVEASWVFGLGYVTPSGFGVDARYNLGISNINDVANTPGVHNRVFQAGVFYQFGAH